MWDTVLPLLRKAEWCTITRDKQTINCIKTQKKHSIQEVSFYSHSWLH